MEVLRSQCQQPGPIGASTEAENHQGRSRPGRRRPVQR
jgi:hypothetical protein